MLAFKSFFVFFSLIPAVSLKNNPFEGNAIVRKTQNLVNYSSYSGLGEKAGTTAYDIQQPCSQGRRISLSPTGDVFFSFTHSLLAKPLETCVFFNIWDASMDDFKYYMSISASPECTTRFTTMGLFPDDEAVFAFNHCIGGKEVAAVSKLNNIGKIELQKTIDTGSVTPQPIYPKIVVGSDGVLHVVACSSDTMDISKSRIYYSRSADKAQTFSKWKLVANESAIDAAVAVSRYGEKVAVVWVEPSAGGTAPCGQLKYCESLNAGKTWKDVVNVTMDRYQDEFPIDDSFRIYAHLRDIDAAYDYNNNLHIIFCEGLFGHPEAETWYYLLKQWSRIAHWCSETGFNAIFPNHPMFATGSEIDSLGLWGVAFDVPEQPYGGCWRPQIAMAGDELIAAFCGQYDSLDVSAAGDVNGDIYLSCSSDNGIRWTSVKDYTEADTGTIEEHLTNITNSHTPDAGPGACHDEDYLSISPWVKRRSSKSGWLHLTYVNDRFAGPFYEEQIFTENPVMYLKIEVPYIDPEAVKEDNSLALPLSFSFGDIGKFPLKINYSSSLNESGCIIIYNSLGQVVNKATLSKGSSNFIWDGMDCRGAEAPEGVYFLEISVGSVREQGKAVVLR
jgi:hypothetical protein